MELGGVLLVASYAFISGYSDGGLTAPSVRLRLVPRLPAALALAVAAGFVPLLLGTNIAVTLSERLLPAGVDRAFFALVIVSCSSAAALLLAALRVPTSLGLALLGAIAGYAIGTRASVDLSVYTAVFAAAAVAPLVGALLSSMQLSFASWLQRVSIPANQFSTWARLAFFAQCAAYGANDGQRMLAVALLVGASLGGAIPLAALIAVTFLAGALTGLRRVSGRLGKIVGLRIEDVAAATTAAAATSLAGAGLGLPLSLSQALAGGLVGAGLSRSSRRVRWQPASQIATSWLVTVPAAAIPSALASWSFA